VKTRRTYLYAISLGAHAALGLALLAIPARARHEIIAISMSETAKPKPPPHVEPPTPEPPKPSARPVRAKAAPPQAKPVEAPPETSAPSSADALPDFGISLSNGGGAGGVAVPVGRSAVASPVTATTKTLTRAARPRTEDCDEPPAKPKLLSRPTPPYTDQARAAGVAGKVRVEITIDEQGRVVAVRVLQGLGYGLDEAAVAAARGMTFEPAVRCGKPASATFKIGFNFSPGTP
jgi:protein TonB